MMLLPCDDVIGEQHPDMGKCRDHYIYSTNALGPGRDNSGTLPNLLFSVQQEVALAPVMPSGGNTRC